MADTAQASVPTNSAASLAIIAAFVALVAFVLSVLEVAGLEAWGYYVSIALAVIALAFGIAGRRRAASGAGGGGTATTAAVIGALLVVLQVGWIVLELTGVIESS